MATPSKNIMWLSISRIISLVLLFLAYLLLTSYLGPYRYGQFQFVLSYITLFGVVIDFGIQQYIIKKISEDRTQAKKYFHNFLAVEIFLSAIVYGSMVAVAWYNGYDPLVIKAIIVGGFGVAINGLTYPFLSVMTVYYDLKKVAFLNFLSSAINVTLIFITIAIHGSIVLLTAQQVIYAVLAVTIYYHFIQKHIGKPEIIRGVLSVDKKLIKSILKSALPFALLVGFSTVYNRIDIVLITRILGYAQTGIYSAAYKFFDLLAFFPAVVSHALYPLFATLMAQNKLAEIRDTLEKYMRFMAALALPLGVGGSILSKQIIGILSPDYAAAAPVLAILVWAPVILFMYIVVNSIVVSQLTKFAMIITGVNVVLNTIGNIILLPRIGIIGAAIMTIASEFVQGLFYFYFVKTRITDFRFFSLIWQPALGSMVMGVAVWYVRSLPIFVAVPIGVVVYGLVLLALRFFKRDDLAYLKTLFSRAV
ncbi:MAG TPA: flippase [Patescibacteria group bacterium]|jgi:O-antigen/teichoic acid export membrane protein|nr:flippase [Patescibacteria group bacterium]